MFTPAPHDAALERRESQGADHIPAAAGASPGWEVAMAENHHLLPSTGSIGVNGTEMEANVG